MQIDVLSSNTLKLTLSRLDMFDLDIKYESLSGKNPETKRLLAHVLKSIELDKRVDFDFSGERLFVEAFPRPDGGCMLYLSCLEADTATRRKRAKRTVLAEKAGSDEAPPPPKKPAKETVEIPILQSTAKPREGQKKLLRVQICEVTSLKDLGALCRCLSWQSESERVSFDSALFGDGKSTYRLVISGDAPRLIAGIMREYGILLRSEKDLAHTVEFYKQLIAESAVERTQAFC